MILYGTNPIAWSNDDDPTLGGDISVETCLGDASSIGFDGIEKGKKFPTDPVELKALLDTYNLRYISGWHSLNLLTHSLSDEKESLQRSIDMLKHQGSSVCIVCETSNSIQGDDSVGVNDRARLSEEQWRPFADGVDALSEFARAQKIEVVYHHHVGTVIESEEEIDRLMSLTESVRFLLDTGHIFFGGGDPLTVAERYMPRVSHIHTKNVRLPVMEDVRTNNLSFLEGVRRGVFTVPGDEEGAIDFEPILRVVAEHNYSGWLVIEAEQDPVQRHPKHYQSLGLRSLKQLTHTVGLDRKD